MSTAFASGDAGPGTGGVGVSVVDLHRTFTAGGQTVAACAGITLDIPAGSVTALLGPSGSGKSTLLHLIGGIEAPDSGIITVGDQHVSVMTRRQLTAYRRSVGLVFQQFNLLPALTAQDNVAAPLVPYRAGIDLAGRSRALLADVGLAGRERSLPSQLSGGQQQRVAIARALVNRPALILADEPTGALDQATGRAVLDLLVGLRNTHGVTVLLATHDPAVADRCDTLITLVDGQLAA